LFGGSSSTTPPPLQLFSLPNSIQSNVLIGSTANGGTLAGAHTPVTQQQQAYGSATQSVYSSASAAKPVSQAATPMDSSAIAAAVKNALLSSNSLGDVIAEI
jgi:hypothetical protein